MNKPDNNVMDWELLISKIRSWDRKEHNLAMNDKSLDHKNLKTKSDLIKELMNEYKLTPKPNPNDPLYATKNR